jgi:hypothetical protein
MPYWAKSLWSWEGLSSSTGLRVSVSVPSALWRSVYAAVRMVPSFAGGPDDDAD